MSVPAAPGDPVGEYLRPGDLNGQDLEELQTQLGLDQPIFMEYENWLERVVRLGFGDLIVEHRPVTAVTRDRLPNTLHLMLTVWIVTILLATPIF